MFQAVSFASHPITVHLWEVSGSIFSIYPDQIVADSNKVSPEYSLLKAEKNPPVLSLSSCVPTPLPAWWTPAELMPVCQYLTCNGEPKTEHRTRDAVWQAPDRGEGAGYALSLIQWRMRFAFFAASLATIKMKNTVGWTKGFHFYRNVFKCLASLQFHIFRFGFWYSVARTLLDKSFLHLLKVRCMTAPVSSLIK